MMKRYLVLAMTCSLAWAPAAADSGSTALADALKEAQRILINKGAMDQRVPPAPGSGHLYALPAEHALALLNDKIDEDEDQAKRILKAEQAKLASSGYTFVDCGGPASMSGGASAAGAVVTSFDIPPISFFNAGATIYLDFSHCNGQNPCKGKIVGSACKTDVFVTQTALGVYPLVFYTHPHPGVGGKISAIGYPGSVNGLKTYWFKHTSEMFDWIHDGQGGHPAHNCFYGNLTTYQSDLDPTQTVVTPENLQLVNTFTTQGNRYEIDGPRDTTEIAPRNVLANYSGAGVLPPRILGVRSARITTANAEKSCEIELWLADFPLSWLLPSSLMHVDYEYVHELYGTFEKLPYSIVQRELQDNGATYLRVQTASKAENPWYSCNAGRIKLQGQLFTGSSPKTFDNYTFKMTNL